MTSQQQTRNSSLPTHETLLNTSIGNSRRRQPSGSIDLKDRIGHNDTLSKQKKTDLHNNFSFMAQKAIREKYGSKQDKISRKDVSYLETSPDMQHSVLLDSRQDSPRDNLNRSFDVKTKKLSSSKKGSRLPTENTFIENRADTIEFIKKKGLSREKPGSALANKRSLQAYESFSANKIGINTTKLANRTFMKCTEQPKLQGKVDKDQPKRAISAIKQVKATDQSFCEVKALAKKKTTPVRQRPPVDERTRKEVVQILVKDESLLKTRKKEKVTKTRSFIGDSAGASFEKSFVNLESEASLHETTIKETRENRKLKDIDTTFDLDDLKGKKFSGLNVDLGMYYDLLVERSRTNAKLLKELKDNYFKVMREFSKNNGILKQYNQMKNNHDEEQEKARKEKDLLEAQLQMLQRENDRLKNLNTKHVPNEKKQVNKSSEKVVKGSFVFKEIKETITEEQRLADLLIQSEQMISFLKAKEVKYMSLFKALEAEGIDLDKIYAKHMKSNSFTEEGEIRMKTLPDMTTETQEDYIDRQIKNNVNRKVYLHKQSWQSSMSLISEDFTSQCPEQSQFGSVHTEQDHHKGKSLEKNSLDLKQKFKLDLAVIQKKVIKQYHEEFMEKWPEFTSSWRRAMERDKTFNK